jgi:RloB-like protein
MSRKPRKFPTTIFIACEGRNTEPAYFERIKEQIEDDGNFALTIYPNNEEKEPKTDVIGLIKECQERIEDFDEVWAVYDKNGYTKHKEAIELANEEKNGKKVKIAFSSIAFEVWVLLHFERNDNVFDKSDCKNEAGKYIGCGKENVTDGCNGSTCVSGYLRSKGYLPTYSKKKNLDIYPALKDKTVTAIINAAWLSTKYNDDILIYNRNPYTSIDFLIKRLFDIHNQYEWRWLNKSFEFCNVEFNIKIAEGKIFYRVKNLRQVALVLNEFVLSALSQEWAKLEITNSVIEPLDTIEQELYLTANPILLQLKIENFVVYLEV